jgi:hypothetical protein
MVRPKMHPPIDGSTVQTVHPLIVIHAVVVVVVVVVVDTDHQQQSGCLHTTPLYALY